MVTRYGYFFNAACQFNTTTIEGFCDPTGCWTCDLEPEYLQRRYRVHNL
jgi:hypothetical protein